MAETLIFHFRDIKSFLNSCNPVTKFSSVIALCFPLVKAPLASSIALLAPLVLLALNQRLPLGSYKRELRFFLFMGLLIALTNYFSVRDLSQALASFLRFFAIILSGMLLSDSTAPDDLARSLGSLLDKIPFIHGWEIASSIELTLSFVPLIFDVSEQVTTARKARQAKTRNPIHSLSQIGENIFSLLLDRAEDLSSALDARSFDPGRKRQTLRYGKEDAILLIATILLVVAGYMLY
jgi:biotin transport system permease protein